ncbi:dihydrolipoyl dehydrogenase [Candidatus Methylomirabilis lanthanidiphila]|uniref:Dihydrolipoyl dehydrogenase n=1 Tax=Candidatus Methylomirabilis lanthanidiphila TaxID=2211376 RepID=A0A564ZLC8_9BACT|nr:dihydrolipoyl dehydrogenase [Candidatus Methylomirabilis lanthanidiphila]VUZ86114.1 dihydrolipoyl dehydrogenase [Candidatus Methylomirabilis lanthanidiphila]
MGQNERTFDLAVIGAGPGGYVASVRAAQLGMRVALVERDRLGGVCLNWGCIPTKVLLQSAHVLSLMRRAGEFGVQADNIRADFGIAVKRSREKAERLSKGIEFLMRKNKVALFSGEARFTSAKELEISDRDGKTHEAIRAERILLATGSRPRLLPHVAVDGKVVLTSTEAMLLDRAPASMIIIGGGAIGVEFADIYQAYGTAVTLVELLPTILPYEDEEITALLHRALTKKGITILTNTSVERIAVEAGQARVTVSSNGKSQELPGETVLVAVGRMPNSEVGGLKELGVATKNGFVAVDERMESSVPGIYAIGDLVGAPLLAHKASHDGIRAVERMAKLDDGEAINVAKIPSCTYCHPQVASVGLTEAKARAEGHTIRVGRFPFSASGMAIALGETEGIIKVIADATHGEILGVHIVGAQATELIAEAGLAISMEATPEEIAGSIHAHPTLSEAVSEAALAALGRAIHM